MVTPTVTPTVIPALTALALSHADSLYRAIDQHRAALQVWLDWVPSTQSLEDSLGLSAAQSRFPQSRRVCLDR